MATGPSRCARSPTSVATILAGAALALAPATGAQVSPSGGELQVNTYTTGNQISPVVTADPQGRTVVAWVSAGSSGSDTSFRSIQAQRFAADGTPLGGQFQVNAYTTGDQLSPALTANALGDFIVVWESAGSLGTDTSDRSIQAQRFGADGVPVGVQFQINTYTTSEQTHPAAASDAMGNLVVAWRSYGSSSTDTSGASIQAQRFAANGAPLGGQFQVNTYTTSQQAYPAVARLASGGFVVAWSSYGSVGDTSSTSVQARRYDASGAPLGGQFQVNTYTSGAQTYPELTSDAQGDFVVVWVSAGSAGPDTSSWSIQAQRYDSSGVLLGAQFQVNSYTTSYQWSPAVASDARGNFVIAWESDGSSGSDTSDTSIQARLANANGTPLYAQFQVNTGTPYFQRWPAVAADTRGNFVVAWASDGSNGSDTSGYSIQAQRYDGLFRDGFESGGTGRWSAVAP